MNGLVRELFLMLRLRSGPQELPASWALTALVIAIYVGEGIITSQTLGGEDSAARTTLAAGMQFLVVALLLRMRAHPERLPQTLLALAGTGILLGLLAFVFLLQADPETNQPLLALVWFAIFGWSLAVDAHIYRHALGIPLSQGVLVAVVILAVTYLVIQFLFR